MNYYSSLGVSVQTPAGNSVLHAALLQCSLDLPGATGTKIALVLNMKQFNGKHGCCYCDAHGKTPPGDYLHRYWPPNSCGAERSHQTMLEDAQKNSSTGDAVSDQLYI